MVILTSIIIFFHNLIDRNLDPGRISSNNFYRYIIIPGGMPTARINAVDLEDYQAVTSYFNIEP
ncbi:MAG: hypothetical protein WD398_10760 [Cyclobacteriaceae bacterium]